ncbi:MAG: hypothetical protein PVSMB3_16120 [Candidatus Dormibacteraceae bacterium]
MNENQIRERLRDAIGEASYPPSLARGAVGRLERQAPEQRPRALGLAAALIALAVLAALLGPRLLGLHTIVPAGPHAQSTASPNIFASIPPGDFDAAGLTTATALVKPFNLAANNAQGKMTLIGAYADPARTVLLLRTTVDTRGPGGPLAIQVSDDLGHINASSSAGGGLTGEYFYSLDAGPRPGPDGLAHLTVTMPGMTPGTFALSLKVQPSVAITTIPRQLDLGSWKVTIEAAEITPSVIHIQAFIDGASVSDTGPSTMSLVDASGPARSVAYSASVTVPKQQLTSASYNSTRMNAQWLRSTSAGIYQLRFTGGGGTQTFNFRVGAPDPSAMLPRKGEGLEPKPTDFPEAKESLKLEGFLNTTITIGRPNSCGSGSGPSGTIFAFGMFFEVDGTWYTLSFDTDPSIKQYAGPGTYTARANLYGSNQRLYGGTVQLTITADAQRQGPNTGSVRGTLDQVGTTTPAPQLSVTGTWSCTPGAALGPG